MSRYKRLQYWLEASDWKTWIAVGVMAILFITIIQDALIDYQVNQSRQRVMASIDHEDQVLHESREKAQQHDQQINAKFSHAMQSSSAVIDASDNAMGELRRKIGMDKGQ